MVGLLVSFNDGARFIQVGSLGGSRLRWPSSGRQVDAASHKCNLVIRRGGWSSKCQSNIKPGEAFGWLTFRRAIRKNALVQGQNEPSIIWRLDGVTFASGSHHWVTGRATMVFHQLVLISGARPNPRVDGLSLVGLVILSPGGIQVVRTMTN